MKLFRVLSMVTALLATAGAAHAQTPPYVQPFDVFPYQLERVSENPAPAWHIKACNDAVFVWQQVRALCATKQQAGCCEAAVTGAQPKACACAKACACCEMCKSKKETAQTLPMALTPEMMRRMAGLHGIAPQPVPLALQAYPVAQPPACLPPMAPTPGVVQIMPVPGVRVVTLVQVAHHGQPMHFVTPDLEAHCERMQHRGDMVILEGSVLLVCKKHAQPIRIEAQRVMVNMRDGSYTVEGGGSMSTTFGIQRTGAVTPMSPAMTPATRCPESAPQPSQPSTCPVERSGIFQFWSPLFR